TLKGADDQLVFSVKDEGIGIPAGLQRKVFEPYFQISNAKGNFQGMGLGLPIVKKVVEGLMGGIQVTSAPHIKPGTEIKVTLMQHQLRVADVVSKNNTVHANIDIDKLNMPPEDQDINRHYILIVEDNTT